MSKMVKMVKNGSKWTKMVKNKLTKLGRCDRYTIEGLIIGVLGLIGVQDC